METQNNQNSLQKKNNKELDASHFFISEYFTKLQ